MLTLQEVKQKVTIPEGKGNVPTVKHLRNRDVVFISRNLGADAKIMVYKSGYAVYQIGRYATVFSVHACGDYLYSLSGEILCIREAFFNLQEWYVRLVLEGEDRVFRNREAQEQEKSISYSAVAEDCLFMADWGNPLLEQVIQREIAGEFMRVLSRRERQLITLFYFARNTQKEIAKELGITQSTVSLEISGAIEKMRKYYAGGFSGPNAEAVRAGKGGKRHAG